MSTNLSKYISNSLSIKDENITFLGEFYTKKINNLNTLVHKAILTYNAHLVLIAVIVTINLLLSMVSNQLLLDYLK